MCSFLYLFLVVFIIQSQIFDVDFPSYRRGSSFTFQCYNQRFQDQQKVITATASRIVVVKAFLNISISTRKGKYQLQRGNTLC